MSLKTSNIFKPLRSFQFVIMPRFKKEYRFYISKIENSIRGFMMQNPNF